MAKETLEVRKKIVFKGHVIAIREDTISYNDGTESVRQILQAPQGVLILPVTDEGNIILTKEYRHNHGKIFGVPMGKMDPGEKPIESAKRELQEELGITANIWTHISTHHNGVHEEGLNHYFLAEKLSHGVATPEDDEEIDLVEMTFKNAFLLMNQENGGFVDLRTRGCIWASYIYMMERSK